MGEIINLVKRYNPKKRTLRENPLKAYILKRVTRLNKNFLMAMIGGTGSGKSYAAVELARQLDPNFSVDRVIFTPQEFMALVNAGLPAGSVILFDEAGVSMDSRTWYSVMNKMINYVLQTFRHRNLIVIFTVPLLKFVDSNARNLFHAFCIMKQIKKTEKASYGSFYNLDINYRTGQVFTKKPRILSGQEQIRVDYIRFSMPPKPLVEAYERKRGAFTKKLNEDIESELTAIAAKEKQLSNQELVDKVLDDVAYFRFIKKGEPRISSMKIAAKFGVGKSRAAFVRDMAETLLGENIALSDEELKKVRHTL